MKKRRKKRKNHVITFHKTKTQIFREYTFSGNIIHELIMGYKTVHDIRVRDINGAWRVMMRSDYNQFVEYKGKMKILNYAN